VHPPTAMVRTAQNTCECVNLPIAKEFCADNKSTCIELGFVSLGDAMLGGAPDCLTAPAVDDDEIRPRPDAGWAEPVFETSIYVGLLEGYEHDDVAGVLICAGPFGPSRGNQ